MRENLRSSTFTSNRADFKEDRPLSFFRGATWFLLALVVAGFFGGAVRSLLSPRHIAQMVEETLAERQPAFLVSFAEARFSVGQGLKPRFGLEFDRVMVQAKDPQVTASTLFIENLYFPIALPQLLRRKLAFSQMEASEVILNLASGSDRLDAEDFSGNLSSSQLWRELRQFIELRWRQELINTQAILRSIRVDRLLVRGEELGGQWLALNDLQLNVSQQELGGKIRGTLEFSPDWLEGLDRLPVSPFALVLTPEQVDFALWGQWREGRYRLHYQVDLKQLSYQGEMQLLSMPQQPLWNLYRQWGVGGQNWPDVHWQNQWVDCLLRSQGEISEVYKFKEWRSEDCMSSGDFGELSLSRSQIPDIFNSLKSQSSSGAERLPQYPAHSDRTIEAEHWPND